MKLYRTFILMSICGAFVFISQAYALGEHYVISGSQRDIAVWTFQGSCNKEQTALEGAVAQWTKDKKKDAGFFDAMKSAASKAMDPGCKKSLDITLLPDKKVEVSPGQIVVAFKTSGNPTPAICKVKSGQNIKLVTIKSAKLKAIAGFSGDFGLECKYE